MPMPAKKKVKGPVILMVVPVALVVLLVALYAVLVVTPLGTDPNAAGIFLPLMFLIGAAGFIGFPLAVAGLIWLIVRVNR